PALSIRNSKLAVCCLAVLCCCYTASARIPDSLQAVEVRNPAMSIGDFHFPDILGERPDQIRKVVGVREDLKRIRSRHVGGDVQGHSGIPAQDPAQLPALDNPRYPSGSVAEQ